MLHNPYCLCKGPIVFLSSRLFIQILLDLYVSSANPVCFVPVEVLYGRFLRLGF